jgi:hypothetical protein
VAHEAKVASEASAHREAAGLAEWLRALPPRVGSVLSKGGGSVKPSAVVGAISQQVEAQLAALALSREERDASQGAAAAEAARAAQAALAEGEAQLQAQRELLALVAALERQRAELEVRCSRQAEEHAALQLSSNREVQAATEARAAAEELLTCEGRALNEALTIAATQADKATAGQLEAEASYHTCHHIPSAHSVSTFTTFRQHIPSANSVSTFRHHTTGACHRALVAARGGGGAGVQAGAGAAGGAPRLFTPGERALQAAGAAGEHAQGKPGT